MANTNVLYGTWQLNEVLESYPSATALNFTCLVDGATKEFKALGKYYGWFCYAMTTNFAAGHIEPYQQGKWVKEEYRIIKISSTSANTTFMQWLQTNAVKLSDSLDYDTRTNKQKYNDLMDELSDVINEKAETTGKKILSQMVETAKTILKPTGTKTITTNGTHNVKEYESAKVAVPEPSGTKEINTNGTHDVKNYANASVNVPIPSGYIKPTGAIQITDNGAYDVKQYETATVNIEKGIKPSGNLDITVNGNYNVTEKASVSVNVPATGIEPSGTKTITANGTHNVREFANAEVNVPIPEGYIKPSGTLAITENGKHNAKEYESVEVNVPTGGGGATGLVDGTITEYSGQETKVRNYAFYNCSLLTKVDLPNATSVDNYAFYGCTKLPSINLPNATNVGIYAFVSCKELTNIDLPNATSIGNYAFQGCSALTNIYLPNVTGVNTQVFYQCYSLLSIDLPRVTAINATSFYNCYSLKAVIIRKTAEVCSLYNTNAFKGCYHILGTTNSTYNPTGAKDGYIYVPRSKVDSYKSATNWSTYAEQIRALEDYTVDGTTTGELDESKI